ncbi:hypothetical protein ACFP1I_23890 [Dyadobacter subterraneus]|uniref:Uncharacterized protein n=1 Tax=Dyadobacter subterraneus TaxID=2773304 RepID=A0ABR9WLW2_9BACT|nr:hypothetical protein [Dyadobacter subterraneus]MBE9466511.1 hypothetical protein [Dyadobacter subterraneus]
MEQADKTKSRNVPKGTSVQMVSPLSTNEMSRWDNEVNEFLLVNIS